MLTSEHRRVLNEISVRDGFRYFSGADEPLHGVHTAMYIVGERNFIVVGVNSKGNVVDQECEDIEDALRTFVLMVSGRDDLTISLRRHRERVIGDQSGDRTDEDLLQEIASRFGRPDVDYQGRESWRVWVHGWHVHPASNPRASHGSFATQGKTVKEAAERLLALAKECPVIQGMHCTTSCTHHIDDAY